MNIAYLHYLYGGKDGTHSRTRHFTEALAARGHEVTIHPLNLAYDRPDDGDDGGGAAAKTPARGGAGRAWRTLRAAAKARWSRWLHEPKEVAWNLAYYRKEQALLDAIPRPDLLYVRPQGLGISIVETARRHDLPLLLEIHAPMTERFQSDRYWHLPWVFEAMEGHRLRSADAITVVSASLGRHLSELHGVPAERFHPVPNGAQVERFRPGADGDPEVDAAIGDGVVIGFVGSFQKWHGTELLADLYAMLGASRPAARFLLVGDGPAAADLVPVMRALGPRGVSLPWVPHERMPALVASMDVGVLPEADFYRCPLKVVEWMAAGKAVVAPDYAPMRELMVPGEEGLLFPPGDRRALADTVGRLVDDGKLRRRLGRAAAKRARTSMRWADSAAAAERACEAALERHAARRAGAAAEGTSP